MLEPTLSRLVHRIQPYPDEDGYGFLMRVAAANHLRSADVILDNTTTVRPPTVRQADLLAIAFFCRNTAEDYSVLSGIEHRSYDAVRFWLVANQPLTKAVFVSTRYAKVCPTCLNVSAHIRGIWLLSFYLACHIHRLKLISVCPMCNKPLRRMRRFISHCPCRFDLSTAIAPKASPAQLLISCLLAECKDLPSLPRSHRLDIDRLAQLSIDGLCKTLWFLGHCLGEFGTYGSGHGRKRPRPEEAELTIVRALALLQEWPHSFGRALLRVSQRPVAPGYASLLDRLLGPLQYYIYEATEAEELSFVRIAYEQHIRAIWRGFGPQHRSRAHQLELDYE